ncbi:MAG: hypothetical protein ABIC82_01925 [bacterium]
MSNINKLTKQQINRQDFVDNQIFELIQKFLPPSKQIDWNIDMVGAVRNTMREQLVNK